MVKLHRTISQGISCININWTTVEPLYYGHHWDQNICPDTCLYKGGTWLSVLIYYDIHISGVSSKRGSTLHALICDALNAFNQNVANFPEKSAHP